MRALNSTASKTIAKVNSGKPSQRKQSPAAEAQPYDPPAAHAHGSRLALNVNSPSTATRPRRPSSRQSALSSFSASSGNLSSSTFKRLPSSEALRAKPSRPTIIAATVAKPARATPISGANRNQNNNNTTTTTTSRPPTNSTQARPPSSVTSSLSRSPHPARNALKPRDQNAAQMTKKASSMSRNVKVTMPPDRSTNSTTGRPTLPHLSASAARGSNRPPLTPKIATTKPLQAPGLTAANAATPSVRRTAARPANGSTLSARSTPQPPEDDHGSFIGLNVTPRSGKRQSRVDSANSTPNGTPDPGRLDGWDRDLRAAHPLSPGGIHAESARRPVVAFNTGSSEPRMPAKHEVHVDLDSKFFHASDIKPSHSAPPKQPTLAKNFYASGHSTNPAEKPSTSASYTSAPSANSSQNDLSSKFIYANGTPDLKPGRAAGSSRPGSVISVNSKAPTSRAPTSAPHGGLSDLQRSISPAKNGQQPHVAQLKSSNMPATSNRTLPPQLGPAPTLRRTSTGTSLSSHSRNGSALMGEADLKGSFISSGPPSPMLPLASPSQPPLTLASIIQAAEDFGEDEESVGSHDDSHSEVASPTKSTHSGDPANDLVANARRERKVQDLQITNASLEAINRTLERQLRKQTSELRRFRRMSRAAISSAASSRVVSEAFPAGEDVALPLSDLDEEGSDDLENEDDEEEPLSDTDSASDAISPSLDARYGRKDEQRLQRDLSKHKELLIDSQKINQSIKRCLDWTEELIKEGRKALEYNIRPSEVVVPGPRVLNPADEEEHTQASINFDPDTAFEDTHVESDNEEFESERIAPLEPKLAGWKPDPED